MKISAKAEYACLAVLALARHGPDGAADADPRDLRVVGDPRALPRADPASAEGGRAGGEHARGLGRLPPGTPRLGDLARRGPRPRSKAPMCRPASRPGTRRTASPVLDLVWESVRAAERAVLDRTTIAQLAEQSSPHEWII